MMKPDWQTLRLKRGEDRRIRAGHAWVFSNEVDTRATPLRGLSPGTPVVVEDHLGRTLGSAYVNPASLICARLYSPVPGRRLDREFFRERLAAALSLRRRYFPEPYYRLAHGESDDLPGLVVDRYGGVCVVQVTTAGMEAARGAAAAALEELLRPEILVFKDDSPLRALEGLPVVDPSAAPGMPEAVRVVENGVAFRAPLREGQKTGWYFDHRLNRRELAGLARGARVLDCFCYVGGWGLQALAAGARELVAVDASATALSVLEANARELGVGERVEVRRGDVFEVAARLRRSGAVFDVVVLDPPAFIKRRRDAAAGRAAYLRLNRAAMELVADGGLLVSASCSHHLARAELVDIVRRAALRAGRRARIVFEGHQGPDHPVHPAIPETAYLKALFVEIRRP
ncbi:class I SAM-dependent rRNA methyltransferase [Dissulfurirhabdus thermomarina]|uniref:Class I SAM-dependent rRNA methyltransferase n=1 Tax=Dissulfurirhabdus thermomarina TaxID=1765737 RepID=A0A6N9TLJ2_DISTH|nr:class I SAM-dependent rRNA methyltransferase [Dissulfurirhabdus thermomarina]NDY42142.1 class I SAM-dependent rRNA methyltransferase [Dissulfurirhabdus thermomarina]NMX23076.1 class I SAM-dependent rRNA methyltransferase [Dissulfurirhabdus thermomarina]